MKPLAAIVLSLLVGCALPAGAASFDCAKARSATEKAICADPELSALDEKMAEAYRQAARLDKRFAAYLLASQRDWLRNRDGVCRGVADCLRRDYQRRVAYLSNPYLKYEGVYRKSADRNAIRLVVWPSHPEPGIAVEVWGGASRKGNVVLQARATVDDAGEAVFRDAGCEYRVAFALDGARIAQFGRCIGDTVPGAYARDFGASPYSEN